MAVDVLNRVPDDKELMVLPYRPCKVSLFGTNGLLRSALQAWFGYSTWVYTPTEIPEYSFGEPLLLDSADWLGLKTYDPPDVQVLPSGYLRILKTASGAQDGFYRVWTPSASPSPPQSIVRATVYWTPSSLPLPHVYQAGFFTVGSCGKLVGVQVHSPTEASLRGAAVEPVALDWSQPTTFTYLWDDDKQIFTVWKDSSTIPLWEIPYLSLTETVTDTGYVSVLFGNDGSEDSAFYIKELLYVDEARSTISNGLLSGASEQHILPNSAIQLEGTHLPPYDAHPWVEVSGPTAGKSLEGGDTLVLTSGAGLSPIFFRRTDPRMGGSFLSRFHAEVAAEIDPAVSYAAHAGIRLLMDKDIRFTFLKEGASYYIGVLQGEGSYLDIHNYALYEHDWRQPSWYHLSYVPCLGKLYVFLDESELPVLDVDASSLPAGDCLSGYYTFDVGILESGVSTTFKLDHLWLIPALDQFHVPTSTSGDYLEFVNEFCLIPEGVGTTAASWESDGWLVPPLSETYTMGISSGTESPYVEACCYFDSSKESLPNSYFGASDGVYRYYLRPYYSKHGMVMYLETNNPMLLTEIDGQTNYGLSRSFGVNWDEPHVYRLQVSQDDTIKVFLDDQTLPVLDISWPTDLPLDSDSTPGGRFSGGTVSSRWRFFRVAAANGWDLCYRRIFQGDEDEGILGRVGVQLIKAVEEDLEV